MWGAGGTGGGGGLRGTWGGGIMHSGQLLPSYRMPDRWVGGWAGGQAKK